MKKINSVIVIIICILLSKNICSQNCPAQASGTLNINTSGSWTLFSTTQPGGNPTITNTNPAYHITSNPANWLGANADANVHTIFKREFYVCVAGNYNINFKAASDNTCRIYIDNQNAADLILAITPNNSNSFTQLYNCNTTKYLSVGLHSLIADVLNSEGYCGFILNGSITGNCLSVTPCPQTTITSAICEGTNGYNITYNYNLPTTSPITSYKLKLELYKNGVLINCPASTALTYQPTTYTGNKLWYFSPATCPQLTGGCIDYRIIVEKQTATGTTIIATVGNYGNNGVVAGMNNDLCCGTQTLPCQPNCTFTGTISRLTTATSITNIVCGSTYNVLCNRKYPGGVFLNCTSPNSNTLLTAVFRNQSGQIIAPFWAGGNFSFPAAGIYIATYYKTNATGNCDSCIITFKASCPLCNFLPVALQNQTICKGSSATFGIAPEIGINYAWTSSPASTLPATSTITVSPTITTTYTLSRTNANPNCPAKISTVTVTVIDCCNCQSTQCTKNLWYQDVSTGTNTNFVCNTQTAIVLNLNKNYHFFSTTTCLPDQNCKMIVKGEFRNSLGQLVIQQTPFSNSSAFNIISSIPGNYTFIIKYYINGIECSQCSIPIRLM